MRLLSCLLLFFATLVAESEPLLLELKGHLSKETLAPVQEALLKKPSKIALVINSSSGDLKEVFQLAKSLFELDAPILVYIDENAVGPAALFPFLADTLSIAPLALWGDVALGSEDVYPVNVLRSKTVALIAKNSTKQKLLEEVALAMCDPEASFPTLKDSGKGALVLNQNDMTALSLAEIVPLATFKVPFSKAGTITLKGEPPLVDSFKSHIVFNPQGPTTIGRIYIGDHDSMISESTWIYVKGALEAFKKTKPAFILLELNTPGGEVFASQKISDALKEMDTLHDIPTVAYINNWALSAGAMLAYSSRYIAVVKDGSMGAAEPILMGEGGKMETAPEKINSALRSDFAARASFFGRNPDIAEAMVDKDVILILRHGKVIKLASEDQIKTKGDDPDKVISLKGKLLTLNATELLNYDVANFLVPSDKIDSITDQEKEAGTWPFAKVLLSKVAPFSEMHNATVVTWQMDWKTTLLAFLANPAVSSILFLAMMLGFYMEINTPGFGVPGSVGLIALFLILLSSYALEIANMLEAILFIAGVAFIAIDLLFIPTFGLLGGIGVILALAGLVALMLPNIGSLEFDLDTRTFNAAGEVFFYRLSWIMGTFVVGLIAIVFLARHITPRLVPFQRLVLKGAEQEGYIAGVDAKDLPPVGTKGEAFTTLRSSGKVLIADQIFEAVAKRGYIEKGEKIVVAELDGSTLVVDTIEQS